MIRRTRQHLRMTCDYPTACTAAESLDEPWVPARTLGEAVAWAESRGWFTTPVPKRNYCPGEHADEMRVVVAQVRRAAGKVWTEHLAGAR